MVACWAHNPKVAAFESRPRYKELTCNEKNRKKSIKERYKKIAESEEFKQAYDGKSIGEVMEIEGM